MAHIVFIWSEFWLISFGNRLDAGWCGSVDGTTIGWRHRASDKKVVGHIFHLPKIIFAKTSEAKKTSVILHFYWLNDDEKWKTGRQPIKILRSVDVDEN